MPYSTDDVQRLVAYCKANLDLHPTDFDKSYGYTNIPLCLIDAIFSINMRYTSTRNVVERFRTWIETTPLILNRADTPVELSVADLIQLYQDTSVECMTKKVYRDAHRTSPTSGILKAEAVLRAANTLFKFGVNYKSDLVKVADNPAFEAVFQNIPGQRSGVSLRYFFMLTGAIDQIKPDRMIMRFVHHAIDRWALLEEYHPLITEACLALQTEYPKLTARSLDHKIWQFQRTRSRRRQ